MKLLFIADGRSPTALSWISFFIDAGDEVHLVSTFPCEPVVGLESFRVIPVAMSQSQGEGKPIGKTSLLRKAIPVGMRTRIRQWLGPLTLPRAAGKLRIAINEVGPDLVHAMRIPYEGMLASRALEPGIGRHQSDKRPPLLISVWGNDFTLHAGSTPWMRKHTHHSLSHADALHTDCQRDQRLALQWGFNLVKPAIVLPGGGGIRINIFNQGKSIVTARQPVVINPRGFRAYVQNDTFFQAIPRVLKRFPEARFLCPTMQSEPQAQKWVVDYGIGQSVDLLPFQTRQQMAGLYQQSQIVVSLTTHDGTPNTLLEALACGCFPVAGDLESLREWITHGENGLLVGAGDAVTLAEAMILAFSRPELRNQAAEINKELIRERAEYGKVMSTASGFYQALVNQ